MEIGNDVEIIESVSIEMSVKKPIPLPWRDVLSEPVVISYASLEPTANEKPLIAEQSSPLLELDSPATKKTRKRNWRAIQNNKIMLRPRKVEAESSTPEKGVKKVEKDIVAAAVITAEDTRPPPELPTLYPAPILSQQVCSKEPPQLHSENSSSNGSESRSDMPSLSRRRRRKNMKFNHKKKYRYLKSQPLAERPVKSPNVAECHLDAACPESSVTAIEANRTALCLCSKKPQVFISRNNNSGDLTCQALDSFDSKVVGCCNVLSSVTVGLHRPSSRTPYIMLCTTHVQRLIRHNCCPGCGMFCTQGKFLACNERHQYHVSCSRQDGCLHCGDAAPATSIILSLNARRDPAFLPKPKAARLTKSAKITPGKKSKPVKDEPLPVTIPAEVATWTPPVTLDAEKYTLKHLLAAVKAGDAMKVLKMMSSGLNPNCTFPELKNQTPLHVAASMGHTLLTHLLLQSGLAIDMLDADQYSPLSVAVIADQADAVKFLVKAGASLLSRDADGMTPLHLAARNGNVDVCNILLSAQNPPGRYVDILDDGGWTPLVWAAEHNRLEVVRFMLQQGADPEIRDSTDQNIALHWAAYGGCVDIVDLLLSNGSDISSANIIGDTPLHIATRQKKYECVILLLARGARCDIRNTYGHLPKDVAEFGTPSYQSLALQEQLSRLTARFAKPGPKILSYDISCGRERWPVQCVNSVDDAKAPFDFTYITESCFTSHISINRNVKTMDICGCSDNCTSGACTCTSIGLSSWYDSERKLKPEWFSLTIGEHHHGDIRIFECNQVCTCNKILCRNRVVQHGSYSRLQVFRTKSQGWGLKTLNGIKMGTFVCEYVGELISDIEADVIEVDTYLFDLENKDGEEFCIDANKYGNLSRFINHKCSNNLTPFNVFVEHQDPRFPRIAFFANQDIEPDTELGYDYGAKFWRIKGKSFTCTCGSENCKYSDKTIMNTLNEFLNKSGSTK